MYAGIKKESLRNDVGKTIYPHSEWIGPVSLTLHKNYLQMDKRPNLKPERLNVLEENTDSTLYYVGIGRDFLNRTLFAQELRQTIEE